MKTLFKAFAVLFFLGTTIQGWAQCAKFEPSSGCLFIIGQDLDAVGGLSNYTDGYIDNVLDQTNSSIMYPAGVTSYTDLTFVQGINNFTDYGSNIPTQAELYLSDSDFDNTFVVIGVDQQSGQLDQVVSGQLDGNIDILASWVKRANRPVFIRYGYEFNGQHNGYNSNTYKNAYRHFVDRMRSNGVTNVAYVWQEADETENPFNLNDYYPGDDYVDWCGISRFWGDGNNMLSFARQHNKPVMVAEATPKGNRVDNNNALWDTWYQPVINLIRQNNDVIKAFAYINQDWDTQPIWQGTFGNSDLNDNAFIKDKWLDEFDDTNFWIYSSSSLFSDMESPAGCVQSDFVADEVRAYVNETVEFENRSNGDVTQNWDFGSGASPATATGDGPHDVVYSTAGSRTVTLTINAGTGDEAVETKTDYILVEDVPDACLLVDDFADGSKNWQDDSYDPVANGAFTNEESNGTWKVSAPGGYDGFLSYFNYVLNDGVNEHSINFDHVSLTPQVEIRVKASKPCALRMDMEDFTRISTDAEGDWNKFEVTTDWQVFTVDYAGKLTNLYGCGGGGQPCGALDYHQIESLRFYINPGWSNGFPWEGPSGTEYDEVFDGVLEFDYIRVGVGCDGSVSACISKDKPVAEAGELISFSSCSSGDVIGETWSFGSDASVASATGPGPHLVSYGSNGTKTITLTLQTASGDVVETTTVSVSSCDALFVDDFESDDILDYTGGSAAFTFDVNQGSLEMSAATGFGEWDFATLALNNGNTAASIDMSSASDLNLYIRCKASEEMALRVSLADEDGVAAQTTDLQGSTATYSPTGGSFNFPVSTEWQEFVIDFTDELWDEWTGGGAMNDEAISTIQLKPNPAYESFPIFGETDFTTGTLYIDYISIGGDCGSVTGLKNQQAPSLDFDVYPNPSNATIYVVGGESLDESMFTIYDATGRSVAEGMGSTIDLSVLRNGSYILELVSDELTGRKVIFKN